MTNDMSDVLCGPVPCIPHWEVAGSLASILRCGVFECGSIFMNRHISSPQRIHKRSAVLPDPKKVDLVLRILQSTTVRRRRKLSHLHETTLS